MAPLMLLKKPLTGVNVPSQMPTKASTTVTMLVTMMSIFHL